VPAEPYQPYSIPPNWGGHAVTDAQNSAVAGAQNSVPSPLSPQRKLRPSKLKYEALELSEVEDFLKEKCLYITVNLVPFESKVFTHYNCCWGPLWKQSSLLIHYSWAHSKAQGALHITIAIVGLYESVGLTCYSWYFGPFESRIGLLTECSCCWGPLQCRVGLPARYSCCWGLLSKQSSLLTHSSCSWGLFKRRVVN